MRHLISDKNLFLQQVRESDYFRDLSHRPSELLLKYPLYDGDYLRMLQHGTREYSEKELSEARPVLLHAHAQLCRFLPILSSARIPTINLVQLIDPMIEMDTSWTIGTTIVLASDESLGHELCHVYQRAFPLEFDRLYARDGFYPIPRSVAMEWIDKIPSLMDNPDISDRYYLWKNRHLVIYDTSFSPRIIDTMTQTILDPFTIHKEQLPINHPHEMLANRLLNTRDFRLA